MENKDNSKMLKPICPESLFDYSIIEDPQFSTDGKKIAFVRMQADEEGNDYHRTIWMVDTDGKSEPYPFTNGTSDQNPRWSPDGTRLAFISSRDGSSQLYVISLNGGEAVQITDMVGGVSNINWSPDSKWIAFNSLSTLNEHHLEDLGVLYNKGLKEVPKEWSKMHRQELQDPRVVTQLPYRTGTAFFDGCYQHIYVISSKGGSLMRLSNGEYHHGAPEWSKDSKFVFSNSKRDQSSGEENFELWSSVLKFDIYSAKEEVILSEVSEEGREIEISPDGRWLAYFYVQKAESPYEEPYYVAVNSCVEKAENKIISTEDQTVINFKWDSDSKHIYFLVHDHGDGKIVQNDLAGGTPREIVYGKRMVEQFDVSTDGKMIAFSVSSPITPGDLFIKNVDTGEENQLTHFNKDFETSHAFSIPDELEFTGTDGLSIQGWYFKPKDFNPQKTYPAVVEIHGGPQIMWGNSFWHEFQVLCSRGYFVFFCNPRGSAGYGARFQKLRGKGGYTDMADIMNGLDAFLAKERSVDQNRLCVTGGSYGGFLTAWIVTHTGRFAAAVAQRGVYDELNMFGSGDIPESVEWYYGGVPREENLKELWEYSPIAHAKNVTTPLLILHSELDYRCPISQAESFFTHLRRNGNRDVNMVRFPREGHNLSRNGEPWHRIERLRRITEWFDHQIKYTSLIDEILTDDQLNQWIYTLKAWRRENLKLIRSTESGNNDIANMMVRKIWNYLKMNKKQCNLIIEGSRLTVEIQGIDSRGITMREILLADRLNKIFFA